MCGTLSLRWFIPFLQRMLEEKTENKTFRTNVTVDRGVRVGEGGGAGFVKVSMCQKYLYSPSIQDWTLSETVLGFVPPTHIASSRKKIENTSFCLSQWGHS